MARSYYLALSAAVLLAAMSESEAAIVDIAGITNNADGRLLAIDDSGNLWRLSNSCDDWRLIGVFPGARAVDVDGNTVALANGNSVLIGSVTGLDFETWTLSDVVPLPAVNVVHVGVSRSTYWVEDSAGSVWIWNNGPRSWIGPCSGPGGPVPIERESFGAIKGRFR